MLVGVSCNTRCNTLQRAAAHCNTPQHAAAHRNTLQHTTRDLSCLFSTPGVRVCHKVSYSYDYLSPNYKEFQIPHFRCESEYWEYHFYYRNRSYNRFPRKNATPPKNHQIVKLKFLGANSNLTKIPIWVCTARFWGIWLLGFGGFWIFGV